MQINEIGGMTIPRQPPLPYMVMLQDFLWDFDVTSGHLREIYGMMTM